jgi:hypothetical protein
MLNVCSQERDGGATERSRHASRSAAAQVLTIRLSRSWFVRPTIDRAERGQQAADYLPAGMLALLTAECAVCLNKCSSCADPCDLPQKLGADDVRLRSGSVCVRFLLIPDAPFVRRTEKKTWAFKLVLQLVFCFPSLLLCLSLVLNTRGLRCFWQLLLIIFGFTFSSSNGGGGGDFCPSGYTSDLPCQPPVSALLFLGLFGGSFVFPAFESLPTNVIQSCVFPRRVGAGSLHPVSAARF